MNITPQAEKLEIIPDKIIHILLKHLMVLKNENAYLKNLAGINLSDKGIVENKHGSNLFIKAIPENKDGSNLLVKAIPENKHGSNVLVKGVVENKDGINEDDELYSIFEQGLIEVLEQYIKNGNGQNTIYGYYSDFVDAVAEKNAEGEKIKEAAANLPLEDTHFLPEQIPVDWGSLYKLEMALRGHLPRTAPTTLYETVAKELLPLYNARKASSAQLREFAGLSEGGIAKHLPKLQRAGLIKKQPPYNYVLTEKSIHILLKLFGIPKNK